MPVYCYECRSSKCGAPHEAVREVDDRHNAPDCPKCGSKSKKVISWSVSNSAPFEIDGLHKEEWERRDDYNHRKDMERQLKKNPDLQFKAGKDKDCHPDLPKKFH